MSDTELERLRERCEDLETELSTKVSHRDLTIRDLRETIRDLREELAKTRVWLSLRDDEQCDTLAATFLKTHHHTLATSEAYDELRNLLVSLKAQPGRLKLFVYDAANYDMTHALVRAATAEQALDLLRQFGPNAAYLTEVPIDGPATVIWSHEQAGPDSCD